MNSNCSELKQDIQHEFDEKDYSETIKKFISYKECINDKQEYLIKLALLYKLNKQLDYCNNVLEELVALTDKRTDLTTNESSLIKVEAYFIMDNLEKVKSEIDKIDESKLNTSKMEEYEYYKLFTLQGEYISVKSHVDFQLFE